MTTSDLTSHAILRAGIPAAVASAPSFDEAKRAIKQEIKLQLLLGSSVLIPSGDFLDSRALWSLLAEDPVFHELLLQPNHDGKTALLTTYGCTPTESLDERMRNWLLGRGRDRFNRPSSIEYSVIEQRVKSWRAAPATLTFSAYAKATRLEPLAECRKRLETIFARADAIPAPGDRHKQFRRLTMSWLNARLRQKSARSPSEDALYHWLYRGEELSRSKLALHPVIWRDAEIRDALIALRHACYFDGETRLKIETTSTPGHAAIHRSIRRILMDRTRPRWRLAIDRLELRDILQLRGNPAFAGALYKMSRPIPELTAEPDLQRHIIEEWQATLFDAAVQLDRRSAVLEQFRGASQEQAAAEAVRAGASLLNWGATAVAGAAGAAGAAVAGAVGGTSALAIVATASPFIASLVIAGAAWKLSLRLGKKRRAATAIANAVIGSLREKAGETNDLLEGQPKV